MSGGTFTWMFTVFLFLNDFRFFSCILLLLVVFTYCLSSSYNMSKKYGARNRVYSLHDEETKIEFSPPTSSLSYNQVIFPWGIIGMQIIRNVYRRLFMPFFELASIDSLYNVFATPP